MHLSGEVLKRVREEILLLSQTEAAEQLGITRSTIQRWERNESSPQPYHRRNLYRVYGRGFHVLKVKIPFEDEFEALETQDETTQERKTIPASESSPSNTLVVSPISREEDTTTTLSSPFPLVIIDSFGERDESQDFVANNMTVHLWDLAYTNHLTYREKQHAIQQTIKDFDTMNATNKNYQMTRREALSALATLPMITLRLQLPGSTVRSEQYGDALALCTTALEGCWQLYRSENANHKMLAFQCVSKYLPALKAIATDSAKYGKDALDLATHYALLKTLLGPDCVGRTKTVRYAQDALALSKPTNNILLQLSAYTKLGWAYLRDRRYALAHETMLQSEIILERYQSVKNTPLLPSFVIGNFYSTYAMIQTNNGVSPDRALGIATYSEPANEFTAFIEFKPSTQWLEAAEICSFKGDQTQAMSWLEKRIDPITLAPRPNIPQSESGRIKAINVMTRSLLQSKEQDMYRIISVWTAEIEASKALKSEPRYREAIANFEGMRFIWPGEERIMELFPLTEHW